MPPFSEIYGGAQQYQTQLHDFPRKEGFVPISTASIQPEVESESSISRGTLEQFLETAERRRPQLLRIASRMTDQHADAEDILQDALMNAYRALPKFRGESKMSTWLSAIVQNTAREHFRGRRRRIFVSIDHFCDSENGAIEFDLPDLAMNPEETCAHSELNRVLHAEIDRLSSVCRRSVELCAIQEIPQSEAAVILNTSLATVKSGVFRGKRVLRHLILTRMHGAGERATVAGRAHPQTGCTSRRKVQDGIRRWTHCLPARTSSNFLNSQLA